MSKKRKLRKGDKIRLWDGREATVTQVDGATIHGQGADQEGYFTFTAKRSSVRALPRRRLKEARR